MRLPFPRGQYADARPDGSYAVLIVDSHIETDRGAIPLPLDAAGVPQNLLYLRLARDGRVAGIGHHDNLAWEWEPIDGFWSPWGLAFGPHAVVYDAQDQLLVWHGTDASMPPDATPEQRGWRNYDDAGTLVTAPDTYIDPVRRLAEYTTKGDVTVGQGPVDGLYARLDGEPFLRLIEPGPIRRVTMHREGDQCAITAYLAIDGQPPTAIVRLMTRAEIGGCEPETLQYAHPIWSGPFHPVPGETHPGNCALPRPPVQPAGKPIVCDASEALRLQALGLGDLVLAIWFSVSGQGEPDRGLPSLAESRWVADQLGVPLLIYFDSKDKWPAHVVSSLRLADVALVQAYLHGRTALQAATDIAKVIDDLPAWVNVGMSRGLFTQSGNWPLSEVEELQFRLCDILREPSRIRDGRRFVIDGWFGDLPKAGPRQVGRGGRLDHPSLDALAHQLAAAAGSPARFAVTRPAPAPSPIPTPPPPTPTPAPIPVPPKGPSMSDMETSLEALAVRILGLREWPIGQAKQVVRTVHDALGRLPTEYEAIEGAQIHFTDTTGDPALKAWARTRNQPD